MSGQGSVWRARGAPVQQLLGPTPTAASPGIRQKAHQGYVVRCSIREEEIGAKELKGAGVVHIVPVQKGLYYPHHDGKAQEDVHNDPPATTNTQGIGRKGTIARGGRSKPAAGQQTVSMPKLPGVHGGLWRLPNTAQP